MVIYDPDDPHAALYDVDNGKSIPSFFFSSTLPNDVAVKTIL